jgi:hypothetical protein
MASRNIDKRWKSPVTEWKLIAAHLVILFEERAQLQFKATEI